MNKTASACAALAISLSLQTAAAESWHTYHGDYALKGISSAKFQAEPVRLWRTKVGKGLASPVVGGDGRLFCIADDSTITALDAKGASLWSRTITLPAAAPDGTPINESFTAPPLYVHKALLVVAAERGAVYGLSPADGTTLWTFEAGSAIQGSPNYAPSQKKDEPGRVFVIAKEEGIIYALRENDGSKLWQSDPLERTDGHIAVDGKHIVLGNCTASILAVTTSDGSTASSAHVGEECQMAGGIAASKGQAFAGNRSGSLAGADLKKGSLMWLFKESAGELFTTPAITDSQVVFHGGDKTLYCLDRASGKKVWSKQLKGNDPLSPLIADDLIIAGVDGTLFGVTLKDGTLSWSLNAGDEISQPAIVDGILIVTTDDGYIAAYGKDDKK